MQEKIKNWHLLFLIGAVSIISIALIQDYVFAQWNDPVGLPGETGDFNLVVNPLVEDLQLNGFDILGTNVTLYSIGDGSVYGTTTVALDIDGNKSICLNGNCIRDWADGSIGGSGTTDYIPKFSSQSTLTDSILREGINGTKRKIYIDSGALEINNVGGGYDLLTLNASSGVTEDALVVNNFSNSDTNYSVLINDESGDTTPFVIDYAGRVGIGTATPNTASEGLLHIKTASGNAELDIQSGSGTHWGIYQAGVDGPLNFWNGTSGIGKNNVVFTGSGVDISGAGNQSIDIKTDDVEGSHTRLMSVSSNNLTETQLQYENMFKLAQGIAGSAVVSFSIDPLGKVLIPGDLEVLGTALGNGGLLWSSGNDGHGSTLDADTLDGKHNGELDANLLGGYEMKIQDDGPGGANPQICVNSGACNYSTAQCSPRTSVTIKYGCTVVSDCNTVCANLNPSNFTCDYNCNGNAAGCDTTQTDHVYGSTQCTTVTPSTCLDSSEYPPIGACVCRFNAPDVSYGKATITNTWFCADTI